MPIPWDVRHATKDWTAFLADARDQMALASDNSTYTAVQGVLLAFRARLTVQEALDFAAVLPAVLRAIFVEGLRADAHPAPWGDRATWTAEAKSHRPNHNLTPDTVIEDTAIALRRNIRQVDLDRLLERIGPDAVAFWKVSSVDINELERRIV